MSHDDRSTGAAEGARHTRMQNGNRFKLGLFGMNCSGSVGTTAPERWNAGWPENREAARLADAAGIEFLLPIARWLGYGGSTDRHGTSFETLSWASALLAATKEIVAFATVHVPLVNPVFAAKSCVTADHVGRGRFGLNVVSGWNVEEFQSFGAQLLEHDDRYGYSEEWVSVVKQNLVGGKAVRLQRQAFQSEECRRQAEALGRQPAFADERRVVARRTCLCGAPCRLSVHGDSRRSQACGRDHGVAGGPGRARSLCQRASAVPRHAEGNAKSIITTWFTKKATGKPPKPPSEKGSPAIPARCRTIASMR